MNSVKLNSQEKLKISGKKLANPKSSDDELVISGISGAFPLCDTYEEFIDNLKKKRDLCSTIKQDGSKNVHPDLPMFCGKLNDQTRFDCGFFGVHKQQASFSDPMGRMLLVKTLEAIFDAGLHPDDLKGTKTGVYFGTCFVENDKLFFRQDRPNCELFTKNSKALIANSLSHYFGFNGPSFGLDSGCSTGLYAFETAYRAVREGKCDRAICLVSNLCNLDGIFLQFKGLGVLNDTTGCRPLDDNAQGFTRAEAIVSMIIEKRQSAKRVYAHIVHAKSNVDGFKQEGITFPSSHTQRQLFDDFYIDCEVSPKSLAYLELHATGTRVGDPAEVNATASIFAKDKGRLFIGSVKGNMGHAEAASGLCSIAKIIASMETDTLIPNIHYDKPRKDIESILTNKFQVVTENIPWPRNSNLAAVNAFGFGGANSHALLERNTKVKQSKPDGIPRLVLLSGRNANTINNFQNLLENNKNDYELIWLMQNINRKNIDGFLHRGYIILQNDSIVRSKSVLMKSYKKLYLHVGSAYHYSFNTFKQLCKLQLFANVYDDIKAILLKNDIAINLDKDTPNNVLQQTLYTACIQIGLMQILIKLNIKFDVIRGYSMGDFTTAYMKGALTLEQTILAIYHVSKILIETKSKEIDFQMKLYNKLKSIFCQNYELPEMNQNVDKIKFKYATAEYFFYNIINPNEVLRILDVDRHSVVLNLDQDICTKQKRVVTLMLTKSNMNLLDVLSCIGKLYELGFQPQVQELYAKVSLPLSRGTPMINSLYKWNEYSFPPIIQVNKKKYEKPITMFVSAVENTFYLGHSIDGRNLFPATGYLYLIWHFMGEILQEKIQNLNICFEKVKFLNAVTLSQTDLNFYLCVNKNGCFEISENGLTLVTGYMSTDYSNDISNIVDDNADEDDGLPLMDHKDIYKEIRQRGYNYKGVFRSIEQVHKNKALIKWNDNWIAFLDNMLQVIMLQKDTRALYVPATIDKLYINPQGHFKYISSYADKNIPVYFNRKNKSIQTPYIEIRGLHFVAIAKKKQNSNPVLETYKFIPNCCSLDVADSVSVNIEIILENTKVTTIKTQELLFNVETEPLSTFIYEKLENIPVVQPNLTIITSKDIIIKSEIHLIKEINYETKDNLLIIGYNLMQNDSLNDITKLLIQNGFIISIEDCDLNDFTSNICKVMTKHNVGNKFIYLLRLTKQNEHLPIIIDISNNNVNEWLNTVKSHANGKNEIIILAQENPISGILGFVNCIRREPYGEKFRCVFIQDENMRFNLNEHCFKNQLDKGFAFNVLNNTEWGTYRHSILSKLNKVSTKHYYAESKSRGNLSNMDWFQGKLSNENDEFFTTNAVYVHYSAINFKDVVLASGKIPVDSVTFNRLEHDYLNGFEFSGVTATGKKIMGLYNGSMANILEFKDMIHWEIPKHWSLAEAATVPCVYATNIYALIMKANMKRGQSILIHSGAGGIGLSALNICTHYNCKIFTTVGTQKKRDFILKHYPNINPKCIGCSRDTSFEEMIYNETNGRGVNIILNSLSDEKLKASVRCLAKDGLLIEIGKFDMSKDTNLELDLVAKSCSYIGVMLDQFLSHDSTLMHEIQRQLDIGIKEGYVKPLPVTTFRKDQLEEAYRYMGTGQHIGKVLIDIKENENEPNIKPYLASPRIYGEENATYVIIGGLGGFGLELVDWLVIRGAKNVICSSRSGITNGYQKLKMKIWKSYGVNINISTCDVTTYEGCEELINEANKIAPVKGIFNLAAVLRDAILENQSEETMCISLKPKAIATMHLDKLSRELCPELKYFVVFSSMSCGRGNAGQSNYGFSNSIMERICEQRRNCGLHGCAIQWGAIGDVGLLAESQKDYTEIVVCGSLQQKISNCLEVLDGLILSNETIVSSMVVAQKIHNSSISNIIERINTILGIKDIKTVGHNLTLSELGMDSMMATEIRLILETDYDIFVTPRDMRILTFDKLIKLQKSQNTQPELQTISTLIQSHNIFSINDSLMKYNELITLVHKPTDRSEKKKILLFPGIDCRIEYFNNIFTTLNYEVSCVMYHQIKGGIESIQDIIHLLLPKVKEFIISNEYYFIAHSYGSILASELAYHLDREGYEGFIVFLDGTPGYVKQIYDENIKESGKNFETSLLKFFYDNENAVKLLNKMDKKVESFEEFEKIYNDDIGNYILNLLKFSKTVDNYQITINNINCHVCLAKASTSLLIKKSVPNDLYLSNCFKNIIAIEEFEGDHISFLENCKLIELIKQFIN